MLDVLHELPTGETIVSIEQRLHETSQLQLFAFMEDQGLDEVLLLVELLLNLMFGYEPEGSGLLLFVFEDLELYEGEFNKRGAHDVQRY